MDIETEIKIRKLAEGKEIMNTTRPIIKIEPHHVEYLIRKVKRNDNELQILRAEAKITHGFLGLIDRLTSERIGGMCDSGGGPLERAEKALASGIFELQNEPTSKS